MVPWRQITRACGVALLCPCEVPVAIGRVSQSNDWAYVLNFISVKEKVFWGKTQAGSLFHRLLDTRSTGERWRLAG